MLCTKKCCMRSVLPTHTCLPHTSPWLVSTIATTVRCPVLRSNKDGKGGNVVTEGISKVLKDGMAGMVELGPIGMTFGSDPSQVRFHCDTPCREHSYW